MTENATGPAPVRALTGAQRSVWDVNRLVGEGRDDLAAELAADRAAGPGDPTPEPVRRGTRAAHRVLLRRARTRR